jgi:hypothetical protein
MTWNRVKYRAVLVKASGTNICTACAELQYQACHLLALSLATQEVACRTAALTNT